LISRWLSEATPLEQSRNEWIDPGGITGKTIWDSLRGVVVNAPDRVGGWARIVTQGDARKARFAAGREESALQAKRMIVWTPHLLLFKFSRYWTLPRFLLTHRQPFVQ
jgi:hypothetical protein